MKAAVPAQPQPASVPLTLKTRQQIEDEVARRVADERERLAREAGLDAARSTTSHFQRPVERPFTAADRDKVTILFGGLTWKHEWLMRGVFESSGYKLQLLPTPDVAGFQLGKEFGNNGQCNPTYFMVGHLIKYLQELEQRGLSRREIADNYVFVTAGSCGPCRFGMYEAEYRLAVENAGFHGFRVLVIQQNEGVNAATPAPGLELNTEFRVRTLTALNMGDVLNDVAYQLRPFEVTPGQTDRALQETTEHLMVLMRDREPFEIERRLPAWARSIVARRPALAETLNVLGKAYGQLYGRETKEALAAARERLSKVEVDRLRVKPVVKITGEFFAQTTEGDGNFRMFEFLEREGAQVIVEPVANWVAYLMWCGKADMVARRDVDEARLKRWEIHRRLAREVSFRKSIALYNLAGRLFAREYGRLVKALGGIAHGLLDMDTLAALARPYYHQQARGGEGHLEVAKNIYYTVNKKAHMVLSLKPFGCMPSSQSDGVQSAVMNHFKDMIFLPIETSGEGEINAHSRVQMALGEARAKARNEFDQALASTGRRLEEIRDFVAARPELRHPFYKVPHRKGVTGTAANFVLHVGALMRRRPALVAAG